jgi:hypothetical protein
VTACADRPRPWSTWTTSASSMRTSAPSSPPATCTINTTQQHCTYFRPADSLRPLGVPKPDLRPLQVPKQPKADDCAVHFPLQRIRLHVVRCTLQRIHFLRRGFHCPAAPPSTNTELVCHTALISASANSLRWNSCYRIAVALTFCARARYSASSSPSFRRRTLLAAPHTTKH